MAVVVRRRVYSPELTELTAASDGRHLVASRRLTVVAGVGQLSTLGCGSRVDGQRRQLLVDGAVTSPRNNPPQQRA